jgi:hypothetical protein
VSGKDTEGAMCIFEFTGGSAGPRHLHYDLDEWIYIIDGEFDFQVGDKRFRLEAGESVFLPRKVAHAWSCVNGHPGKIINIYQPAGRMEEFFRAVGKFRNPPIHEALSLDEFKRLFQDYGLKLLGPPLGWDEYLARQAVDVRHALIKKYGGKNVRSHKLGNA